MRRLARVTRFAGGAVGAAGVRAAAATGVRFRPVGRRRFPCADVADALAAERGARGARTERPDAAAAAFGCGAGLACKREDRATRSEAELDPP